MNRRIQLIFAPISIASVLFTQFLDIDLINENNQTSLIQKGDIVLSKRIINFHKIKHNLAWIIQPKTQKKIIAEITHIENDVIINNFDAMKEMMFIPLGHVYYKRHNKIADHENIIFASQVISKPIIVYKKDQNSFLKL